jgi:ABC-type transporter Mla subunit MlaD
MGASDAINARRTESLAKTSLVSTISDQLAGVNQDSQRVSGIFSQAKSQSESMFNQQLTKLDTTRSQLRNSLKGLNEAGVGFIFEMINAIVSGGGGALGLAADAVTMAIDIRIMMEDIKIRDRTWAAAQQTGTFVQMYTPALGMFYDN